MLLLRLTCFFFIYLVSGPLLAAEPITFFKTGIGKSTEEEVVDLSNLQVVVGDRLRVRIESYDDINVTVRRAFISESDNLVLSGEVSAFQSLTLVIGTDGTVVGSISTKENSFRLVLRKRHGLCGMARPLQYFSSNWYRRIHVASW